MSKTNIDILDILIVLAKRKKFIILATFLVTVVVIIYSLLATKYWKSSVTFFSITQGQVSSLVPQALMGGMASSIIGAEASVDALSMVNIIQSRRISQQIVRRFDLVEYFEIDDPDSLVVMEQAVKQLHEEMLMVNLDPESGLISITVETKDRYLSSDIANAYFELLEQHYIENKMSKGRERRMFLEQRVADFEESFARLSKEVEQFQIKHNIVDMDAQREQMVNLYAELVAEKLEAEIELEYTKKFAGENTPLIRGLQDKVNVLNRAISQMESGGNELGPKYIINMDDVPEINNRYMQLSLNLEIQRKVIEYLYPQYENAKLDELSDISSLELVDDAVPAGLRSRPRRGRMVIIGFIVAFIISSLIAYTVEILTNSPRKDKFNILIAELTKLKSK